MFIVYHAMIISLPLSSGYHTISSSSIPEPGVHKVKATTLVKVTEESTVHITLERPNKIAGLHKRKHVDYNTEQTGEH